MEVSVIALGIAAVLALLLGLQPAALQLSGRRRVLLVASGVLLGFALIAALVATTLEVGLLGRPASNPALLAYGVAFLGVSALLFFLMPARRFRRSLRRMPVRAIADAFDGTTCKLVGRIVSGSETLLAPASGRACVHYELTIREHHFGDKRGPTTLVEDAASRDFFLEDGSGLALVRAAAPGTHRLVVADRHLNSARDLPSPQFLACLDRYRLAPRESSDYRLVASEGVLEVGATVTVFGFVRRERTPGPTSMPGASVEVSIGPGPDGEFLVSNDPRLR